MALAFRQCFHAQQRKSRRRIGNQYVVTLRDAHAAYFDLATGKEVFLRGVRSGCSNSLLPAGGISSAPNFAHGCSSGWPLLVSFAMVHMSEADGWAPGAVVHDEIDTWASLRSAHPTRTIPLFHESRKPIQASSRFQSIASGYELMISRLTVTLSALAAFCGSTLGGERERILDLGNDVSLELVLIPAGSFLMGVPEGERLRARDGFRQCEVTITKDFYMGCCEVTRGQFAAFVRDAGYQTEAEKEGRAFAWDGKKWDKVEGASWKNAGFEQTEDHPVICVSWNDAVAFSRWLSSRTGQVVRLPTEAEWEYACRAETKTLYSWGEDPNDGEGWCNAADKTGKQKFRSWRTFAWEDGYVFTAPVGRFKANGFGLYDMHGNVWEWCSDWYDELYPDAKAVDPQGPSSGTLRVLRGGSWLSSPVRCRSGFRSGSDPQGSYCDFIVGFRVLFDIAR